MARLVVHGGGGGVGGGGCNSLVTMATLAELQVMLITPIRLL